MTKLFGNLQTESLEEVGDRLGGGFEAVPSALYDATIKVAYAGQSQRGARNVTVIADLGGKEFRETIYITNTKGENFYADKQDASKKMPLPGFTTIDDLCLLVTGMELAEQETEVKMVKVYSYDAKAEVPTEVQVLSALTGKPVKLGILREVVDRTKVDDSGIYQPTGETRTQNTIDKVFHPETGRTVSEYRHEVLTAEFLPAWQARNEGKDRMKAKGLKAASGGDTGTGRPGMPASPAPGKKKLFAS